MAVPSILGSVQAERGSSPHLRGHPPRPLFITPSSPEGQGGGSPPERRALAVVLSLRSSAASHRTSVGCHNQPGAQESQSQGLSSDCRPRHLQDARADPGATKREGLRSGGRRDPDCTGLRRARMPRDWELGGERIRVAVEATRRASQALPTGSDLRGRMNSTAASWQRSELVTRTIFARRVRTEDRPAARSLRGAEGISKVKRDDRGRLRRVARTAPPALTSSTVVKSRKSFPLSSTPRANTGIARGNLSQRRLSEVCFRLDTRDGPRKRMIDSTPATKDRLCFDFHHMKFRFYFQ